MSTKFASVFPRLTLFRLAKFDEAKIERYPEGDPKGGQFAPKGGGGAAGKAAEISGADPAVVTAIREKIGAMGGAIGDRVKLAKAAEPKLTGLVNKIAGQFGGKMEGLNHRIKTRVAVESKIIRKALQKPGKPLDRILADMKDMVRYTMVLPHGSYVEGARAAIISLEQEGWEAIDKDNFWQPGNIYKGINFAFENKDGTRFELQFHTPQSYEVKQKESHPLFEKAREPDTPPSEREKLVDQMRNIWNKVIMPAGVSAIGIGRMMTL